MKGARLYALERERETRAVQSCLCDKPLKYQMGGRVKQSTARYDREK